MQTSHQLRLAEELVASQIELGRGIGRGGESVEIINVVSAVEPLPKLTAERIARVAEQIVAAVVAIDLINARTAMHGILVALLIALCSLLWTKLPLSMRVLRSESAATTYKRDADIATCMQAITPDQVFESLKAQLCIGTTVE